MTIIVKTQVVCSDCGTKFFAPGTVQSGSSRFCPSCKADRRVQAIIVVREQIERKTVKL